MAKTVTGQDPFAGAPGSNQPAPATTPTSTATPSTDTGLASGVPQFTATGTGSSKTFGGIPTSQFPTTVQVPPSYAHTPGLSPEDQMSGGQVMPAYKDGDQWTPGDNPDPDYVRNLQLQMIQAGLLDVKKTHLGLWDAYSAGAYSKVLAQANVMHVDASTALDRYVQSELSLPTSQLSGPDLQAVGNNAAQAILGRDLNPDELKRFESAFQSAFSTQQPQSSAGTTQLAQNTVQQEHAGEAKSYGLGNVAQRAMAILGGPPQGVSEQV